MNNRWGLYDIKQNGYVFLDSPMKSAASAAIHWKKLLSVLR